MWLVVMTPPTNAAFAEARGVDTAFKPQQISAGLHVGGMTGFHVTADECTCARRVQVDVWLDEVGLADRHAAMQHSRLVGCHEQRPQDSAPHPARRR
jgi:hypothetical protein